MLAINPNPATIPLPPSPLDGPTSTIPRTQEALYTTTTAAGDYQQKHGEVDVGESGDRRASTNSEHYFLGPTAATRSVGNRDPKLSAGAAASIALRAHRPVEVASADISNSAGRAAVMATREVKSVFMQVNEPISFANSAALIAHKAAAPAAESAGSALHPQHPAFPRNVIYGDEVTVASDLPSVIPNATARSLTRALPKATKNTLVDTADVKPVIHKAAAKSASNALPRAVEETLEATEARNKRKMIMTANLEEAARKAAARRLALLDQELLDSGVLRRLPLSDSESEYRQPRSPTRSGEARTEDAAGYPNLLEIARRNVSRLLTGIDHQVAEKKGLSYRKDWHEQAVRIAESRTQTTNGSGGQVTSEIRPGLEGKYYVGGGRFVDAEEVERIALRNVQPLLDEITAKAEAERARVAAERAEAEEKKRLENLEKERSRETKEEKKEAKAAEKAETSRQKSEAKREKRVSKVESQASEEVDGYPAEQPGTIVTRDMPPPPPQEPKSKLRKLLDKLRRTSTSPPPETEKEKFAGGAAYALEKEREERERTEERRVETAAEQRAPGVLASEHEGPGEVFWDKVEYIDPEEYKRRQAGAHAPIVGRLVSTTVLFRDESVQRRPPGGVESAPTSDGGFSVSTPGYPELHIPPNSECKAEAAKYAIPSRPTIEHDGPGHRHRPGEDVAEASWSSGGGTAVPFPLYDHPIHPADVTVVRTVIQEEAEIMVVSERGDEDLYSGGAPASRGKSVRIAEPEGDMKASGLPGRVPGESRFTEGL